MGPLDNFSFNIPGTREERNINGYHNVAIYAGSFGMGVVQEVNGTFGLNYGFATKTGEYPITESVRFKQFDPIAIRCVALEWFNTHGGNKQDD